MSKSAVSSSTAGSSLSGDERAVADYIMDNAFLGGVTATEIEENTSADASVLYRLEEEEKLVSSPLPGLEEPEYRPAADFKQELWGDNY